MKRVILEGCNGEWAQECYLPVLAGKAAKGDIELWAVDIADEIELGSPQAKKDWQAAQSKNRAHYLNKKRKREAYNKLPEANYVFVVAPDRFHSEIASFWLDRLAPGGKVFIEKPLDASVESARSLKEKIEEKRGEEAVFAFDHYLARAYPFLKGATSHLKKIGRVEKIEFHLLECSPISKQREKTLDKGMIFDLFCHGLALVCAVVDENLTCSAVKLEKVKAARYAGCPISGETFALIKFMVNDMEVVSALGKCVGVSDDKFVKLWGPNGNIKLDFVKDTFLVSDSNGRQIKEGKLAPEHVKPFLDELLQGKEHPLAVPGVFSFDAALEILRILDKAKTQISKMPEYQCNDSIDKILKRLKEGELQ